MFTDKDIANAVLESSKHHISDLTRAATESSGQLRQTLMQMRNQCEQDQAAFAQYAIQQNWYMPASPCDQQEKQQIANFFQSSLMQPSLR